MSMETPGRHGVPAAAGGGRPGDPLLGRQWHLGNADGVDLAVRAAWRDYSGRGVTVGIWDDGIDYRHPDLRARYDPRLHIAIDGMVHDPAPEDVLSAHGTAVAGLIAAAANGRGMVGVAHGARIAGVDILYDPVVTADFARSFQELGRFAVTNHSWTLGPYVADRLDPGWGSFFEGWTASAATGRGGLGTVNVVAAGNARQLGRHTNDSNLTGLPQAIAVAAVGEDGFVTALSTPGPGLLVSAPGEAIWSTDRRGPLGFSDGANEAGNPSADYTAGFGGTSAAAAMVAGVAALMLEANPRLGWRDVQSILALTARHVGSEIGEAPSGSELSAWQVNGAGTWNGGGLHFSNDYGFGLVDARAAVRLAETWSGQRTSGNWALAGAEVWSGRLPVADGDPAGVELALGARGAVEVEAVSLRLGIEGGRTSDYEVRLTSPAGTTSLLARAGGPGTAESGEWLYASNAFRGEPAAGDWRVDVADLRTGEAGALVHAQLKLLGAPAGRHQVFVLTEELSDRAGGPHGRRPLIADADGGRDALNAATVRTAARVDLAEDRGVVDGVRLRLARIEDAFGGDGDDRLIGDAGRNRLEGGRGDDVLRGGPEADRLGDGPGSDILRGGAGRDAFVLADDGRRDRVQDFQDGLDRLRLPGADFEDLRFRGRDDGAVSILCAGERLLVEAARGELEVADLSRDDFLLA
jgi:subtilisin family serine protease